MLERFDLLGNAVTSLDEKDAGNSYGSVAVLEGRGTLAFFYMWPCQYIQTRETCSFCFQVMADMA